MMNIWLCMTTLFRAFLYKVRFNYIVDLYLIYGIIQIMEILVDASAIMAVIVKEPERDLVIELTKNAVIVSPDMVSYEIANALTKMMKKKVIEKERLLNAFE